ncbi:SusC/RagA family TonB-linked outer membrane protein [Nonlabens antarcticus]|uniref:SusC/RagA family TonB-linked outer membrane protein n=1 Tax=Nonlabens antarcticus TaxID=392714 RepID=UPI001E378E8A|nr:TonB-dependent receptor [Nonlabens antarcticus]
MRSFLFLFCISAFGFTPETVTSQNTTVKIDRNKTITVDEVFDLIMEQTDYRFVYQEGIFNAFAKVNLKKGTVKANDLLNASLKGGNFSVSLSDKNTIIIKSSPYKYVDLKMPEKIITGIVKDPSGMPLAGVSVTVEGTNLGAVTNFDGEYTVKLKDGESTLVFSYLGYKTERAVVEQTTVINITMQEDFAQLEGIVLIGYGEQKREDVTGAVSSIDTKELVQSATGSIGFDKALGGLVKGVNVSQSSGRPGSPVRINVRGITSPLSSNGLNQPLFVIDGVPFNLDAIGGTNPLLTLDPTNIESFDVLKDAAATSIYGSRGANGVIIIQTKKGKRNQKPRISTSFTTTIAEPINTVDALNGPQYRAFYDLLVNNSVNAINTGQLDAFTAFDLGNVANVDLDFGTFQATNNGLRDDVFGTANTDWNKEVFRSAAITKQANVGLLGGSENTNYSMNLAFIDQEGLTVKDELQQYTLGMSLDSDINDFIKVGSTINVSYSDAKNGENTVLDQFTVNTSIARARPDLPVYDEDGNLLAQPDYQFGFETFEPNPLMRLGNKTRNKAYNFIGNTYLEIEPIKSLKIKADVNAAVFNTNNSSFIPGFTQTNFGFGDNDSFLFEDRSTVSNITTNLTANYNFSFGDHRMSALAGAAWDRTNFDTNTQFYSGFPDEDILINGSSAENVLGYSSSRRESGLNSLFSRVTYAYKNLYNATVNFRTDTSSKFGPGNKRAYFPSLSTSWNIANEEFLSENESINDLKIRASVGQVGSTNVSDFVYLQFFETNSSDIYNGSSAIVANNTFPNKDIGWEETSEVNLGLDFGFFNSRLRGSIDVYSRKTEGALVNTPIALELGPNTYFANFIDVTNKGVELGIGGDIIQTEDFTWSARANWSLNRNKLVKLNGASINPFQLDFFVEGEPVGTIKGYKVAGIFQSQDEVDAANAGSATGLYDQLSTGIGDFKYVDVNGDGQITADDRTIIGDIESSFFGGISNTFTYKNFSLTSLFQYSVGGESIWNAIPQEAFNALGPNKYSEYALNTWTPENTDARYARALYFDPSQSSRVSDRYLFDNSYLRLKSLQLTYNFNQATMQKMGVENLRLLLTGSNLVTWTKWPGLDPESFSERGGITSQTGNDDPYPLAKSFSLGLQVQF